MRQELGYMPLLEFQAVRRDQLIPPIVQTGIDESYEITWGLRGKRSLESANPTAFLKRAMWLGEGDGSEVPYMDSLSERIEAVRRAGDIFRFLDVGSGSGAMLFTGIHIPAERNTLNHYMSIQTEPAEKIDKGIIDDLHAMGFSPGIDFECVAIHGGEFAIDESPGLKLITANMYYGFPEIEHTAFHCITAIRSVYHKFGGLYIIEYLDRLLARDQIDTCGACFVQPWDSSPPQNIFFDSSGREIRASTVFALTDVGYWHEGRHARHAHWVAQQDKYVHFPVKPLGLCQVLYEEVLMHTVDPQALLEYEDTGGIIEYEDHPVFPNGTANDDTVLFF